MTVKHPSKTSYDYGCRCDGCRTAANISLNRYRRRRVRYGGRITEHGAVGGACHIPAGPVRGELDQLRTKLTVRRIAQLAGLRLSTVYNLTRGKYANTHREVAGPIHDLWFDYFGDRRRERNTV